MLQAASFRVKTRAAADHGTSAGRALLEAIDPAESAALWVADPNPRAHAFYRKHGFVADGTAQVEDGVREIAWSATCSTLGSPARWRAPSWRRGLDGAQRRVAPLAT
jgi:hypothetical protein